MTLEGATKLKSRKTIGSETVDGGAVGGATSDKSF